MTAASLYILQRHAHDKHCASAEDHPAFEEWCHERSKLSPLLLLVNSPRHGAYYSSVCMILREVDFNMCLDALTELVPWFFALDHTHDAHWIPVHLRDMAELPSKRQEVSREFNHGHFTAQKSKSVFSTIPLD